MSLPRYPEYKDSGVAWLGEVPAHWATPPLYLRYRVELGKMLDSAKMSGENLVPYLRNVDVQWNRINFDELPSMDITEGEVERYTVREGDLLVCEGGEVGRAAIVPSINEVIGFQKALHRLRALANDEHPGFMQYMLTAAASRGVFSTGGLSTIAHLTGEQLRKYRFAKPSLAEQTAIAFFLDCETAKIDGLVAEQEKLLSLLAEKRQAAISHTVTKGLNPDAPMKDSGVKWLGEVPAHWDVLRIKHLVASLEQGWSPQCEGFPVQSEGEWGVLKVGCVNGGVFRPEENKTLPPELEPLPELGLASGDLLISRANTRELVGSAAVALRDYPKLMLCDKLYRLRLRPDTCAPVFLALYLCIPGVRGQIELSATGASSSMLNIGQATILELGVVVPPLSEQAAIISFLDAETARLDALTVEARRAIDLLKDRRTALISAAVTGKVDVRSALQQQEASHA